MPASPQIGILLNSVRCAYSYALGDALQASAEKMNLSLCYLPVGWAQASHEADEGALKELLEHADGLSGMLMVSSVFSHGLSSLAKFAQRWWPRPACSIGYRLPLVPSVVVDNRIAMQTATTHLIRDHGRKRILFFRGRADSQEANDRYFGFRKALMDNQLISSSSRVVPCDFTQNGAVAAMAALPENLDFDAVIAANDEMALGVLSELKRRKVSVPEDVTVMGFDNVPAARNASTPLSTMAQPFESLAQSALSTVAQQVAGANAPLLVSVPAHFIPRVSCGCAAQRVRTDPRRRIMEHHSRPPIARF